MDMCTQDTYDSSTSLYICMYAYIYIYIFIYLFTCMHACTHAHVHDTCKGTLGTWVVPTETRLRSGKQMQDIGRKAGTYPKGSMQRYSTYMGLKRGYHIITLRPMHVQ